MSDSAIRAIENRVQMLLENNYTLRSFLACNKKEQALNALTSWIHNSSDLGKEYIRIKCKQLMEIHLLEELLQCKPTD